MILLGLFALAASPHTVAVDLSALDRKSYLELDAVTLERGVVIRLVQEGFAVVTPNASPEIRLRITREGRSVSLVAGERSAVVELDPKHLREFHLEVAQKAVELTRAAATALPEPPQTPPPEKPAAPVEPAVTSSPAPEPPPRPLWNVLAAGGILLRAPGLDPFVALATRLAATPVVGVHLEVALAPVVGGPLSAYDANLLVGAGLQLTQGVFRLELGLSLGAHLHVFTVDVLGAEERLGSRVDFVGRPFVRGTLNPVGGLLVWLQVGAGLSSRAREHRLQGQLLYSRGALWVDVQLGLVVKCVAKWVPNDSTLSGGAMRCIVRMASETRPKVRARELWR